MMVCTSSVTALTIAGMSLGIALVIPLTSVKITWRPVFTSIGRFSIMPSAKPRTSCKAPSAICGNADINAFNIVKIN